MKAGFPIHPHQIWVFKYFVLSLSSRELFFHNVFLTSTLVVVKQQSWIHQKCFSYCLLHGNPVEG